MFYNCYLYGNNSSSSSKKQHEYSLYSFNATYCHNNVSVFINQTFPFIHLFFLCGHCYDCNTAYRTLCLPNVSIFNVL